MRIRRRPNGRIEEIKSCEAPALMPRSPRENSPLLQGVHGATENTVNTNLRLV
jgi:hypothetical protein